MKRERKVLGRMLRRARERRGLSQRDLYHASGVSQPRISQIEAGLLNIELHTLFRLVRALKLPLWRMLQLGGADA